MKKIWLLLLVVVSVLVVVACSNNSPSPSIPPESAVSQQAENNIDHGSSPASQTEEPASPPATPSPSPSETPSPSASREPSEAATPSPSANAKKQPNNVTPPKESPTVEKVTISIVGNAEWGTILDSEPVDLKDGDTAASVLKRIAKSHRLSYEISGSGELTYVQGIDGLYEFDDGPTSGWKYRVNGKVLDVGAGAYELKPGDRLEWFYTSEDEAAKENKESGT